MVMVVIRIWHSVWSFLEGCWFSWHSTWLVGFQLSIFGLSGFCLIASLSSAVTDMLQTTVIAWEDHYFQEKLSLCCHWYHGELVFPATSKSGAKLRSYSSVTPGGNVQWIITNQTLLSHSMVEKGVMVMLAPEMITGRLRSQNPVNYHQSNPAKSSIIVVTQLNFFLVPFSI